MPIYEYKCPQCNKDFNVRLMFDKYKTINVVCPKCGNDNVVRVYNSPTIIYKGSGFYNTENKEKENVS